jgi:hypothetical protein
MPHIRVHSRHDPVGGDLTGDPPPPIGAIRALRGLDILPSDQRQQHQRPLRLLTPLAGVDLGEHLK